MDERGAVRFDQFHAKAGSPTGGQFSSASGGSGGAKAKAAGKAPAAQAGSAHGSAGHGHGNREQLIAQAHADLAKARALETQLDGLQKQEHAATQAAKHSAAQATKAKKAGHVVHHHAHTAAHKKHAKHAATLKQRISGLKTEIHGLREHARELEHRAHASRAAGAVTNPGGTERLHQYWVHGKGAAKIQWGQPGDFDRCVAELGKYIKDPKGYCNLAHHSALGIYPATHAAMEHKAGRADMTDRAEFMRLYPLEDIHILRSADGGDGRTVEAYAAVFNTPAEIRDFEGHYVEEIDPAAFSRAIDHAQRARGGFPGSVKVLWNHGMTIQGTASDRFSMPIGVPVDIKAEARGLLTRTRYSETPLADEVLENIRNGSITSQSFTGRIMRSDPQLRNGDRYRPRGGELQTVRRTELGLREYGPVLWPAYSGAEILGVRMSVPGGALDPDENEFDDANGTPPDDGPATGDPLTETDEHSARYHQHALYELRSKEQREAIGLVW